MIDKWHGTANGYGNLKCRCELCRQAWAAVFRERKRRAKVNGQCAECSQPSIPGYVRCEKHRESNRARTRRYYYRHQRKVAS